MVELKPFIYIRHGETDWNRAGLFQGRSDIALNENGRRQARAAAFDMKGVRISKVLVSPLQRAVETATLAFPNDLDRVQVEDLLIECDFGSLDGKSIKEAMEDNDITRKEQLADIIPIDGETWSSVRERCNMILDRVAELQTDASVVVLVGHDAIFQGLSEILTGRWCESQHGQPYYFKLGGSGWHITPSKSA